MSPLSLPMSNGRAKLYAMEDNDAVIKMTVKGRSPNLRHVARTHRVDLDWLFERVSKDPGCFIKFVGTKEQLADILTKGSFTAEAWNALLMLCMILPPDKIVRLNIPKSANCAHAPGDSSSSQQISQSKHSFATLCNPRACLAISSSKSMASVRGSDFAAGGDLSRESGTGVARGDPERPNTFLTWAKHAATFVRSLLLFKKNSAANLTGLASIKETDPGTVIAFTAKTLEKSLADKDMRWKYGDEVKKVLAGGDLVLKDSLPVTKPRDLFMSSDSCNMFGDDCDKGDPNALLKVEWDNRKQMTSTRIADFSCFCHPGGKIEDLRNHAQEHISKVAGGNPKHFTGMLNFAIAFNDIKRNATIASWQKMEIIKSFCVWLNLFPIGSVSLIMGGTREIWGYTEDLAFDEIVEEYINCFAENCIHPIYNRTLAGASSQAIFKFNFRCDSLQLIIVDALNSKAL